MKNITTILCCAMIIATTAYGVDGMWVKAVQEGGKVATIIIDKTAPVLTAESTRWAEALLIIAERTGVSVDKMTVTADKLGTGALYVVAGGMTIYSIHLVCNAGCTIKSSLWPSEEEIQAKLDQHLSRADRIARFQAKQTFEQCLDKHIEEPGFPAACENVARAYAKLDRYNEVNNIKAFFNQPR